MGDDFSSMKVFAARNPEDVRAEVVRDLPLYMATRGLGSADGERTSVRSIVVGPAGRWIHIGDTAGSTETADPEAFDSLASHLSTLAPVVSIKVSDSAAVHFELREGGALVDIFGNMRFPFYYFADEREAEPYSGHPEAWRHLLKDDGRLSMLREAWTQASQGKVEQGDCDRILAETADLLGLDQDYLTVGYTHDMDGVALPYREYLSGIGASIEGFDELHFDLLEGRVAP